jgi:hypothetical protein
VIHKRPKPVIIQRCGRLLTSSRPEFCHFNIYSPSKIIVFAEVQNSAAFFSGFWDLRYCFFLVNYLGLRCMCAHSSKTSKNCLVQKFYFYTIYFSFLLHWFYVATWTSTGYFGILKHNSVNSKGVSNCMYYLIPIWNCTQEKSKVCYQFTVRSELNFFGTHNDWLPVKTL